MTVSRTVLPAHPTYLCRACGTRLPGPHTSAIETSTNSNMKQLIRKSLEAHGGNVSVTARALGVSRNTIYRKVPNLK